MGLTGLIRPNKSHSRSPRNCPRRLHVAARRPEIMKIVVRSPAFRRKLLASWNESVSDACGLKAGLQTDCLRRLHVAARRPEIMKITTRGRANWQFAWFSRKIASKELWQADSLPSL